MDVPETRYARSGDLQIAYQVVGEGPLDVVLVPSYLSNIELFWELPSYSRFFERLSSFSRLILFDRRGSGMSDGIAGATPLEEQIDDVQAVIDAVGSEQPVLTSYSRGLRLDGAVRGLPSGTGAGARPGVAAAPPGGRTGIRVGAERRGARRDRPSHRRVLGHRLARATRWLPLFAGEDDRLRRLMARIQRLAMSPAAAAASLAMIGETDVRDVLPSVQCPTLVLRPEHETYLDERHSRYVAEHIPNAR